MLACCSAAILSHASLAEAISDFRRKTRLDLPSAEGDPKEPLSSFLISLIPSFLVAKKKKIQLLKDALQ